MDSRREKSFGRKSISAAGYSEKQPVSMGDLRLINAMDDTLSYFSVVFVMLFRSSNLGFQEPQAHFWGYVHCSETLPGASAQGVKERLQ